MSQAVELNYPMSYDAWQSMIGQAIARIDSGALQKVVLSRVAEIRFDTNANVDAALDSLAMHYADCYRFLFEPRPQHAFFGATPELLARVEGRSLRTMALAGTIRRGQNEAEDAAQGQHLMNDPKERHEHALVADALRQRLAAITTELDLPDAPHLLKLSTLYHLQTPVQATLNQQSGVLPVLETLHPTPALGGAPRDQALRFISQHEPVPRGWYAAPVGWIDHNLDGVFAVAIRSAVSQDKRVWLYAGAGIVGDSQPQRDWDETALKFGPMLSALGVANAEMVK
jgi:menaquinone-specific isochorismate synthase